MKINEAFKEFAHELEIDQSTVDEAVRLHERARAPLEANLEGCERTTLSGSYPRSTRLAPLNDIDMIAVVKSTAPWNDDPETALRAAGQIVVDEFPGSTMENGNHAAKISNLDSTIKDVHLDVVVGYEIGSGTTLRISETQPQSDWIKSDPEAHARDLTDANEAWDKKLKPTTKQIKHWNRREEDRGRQMPSLLVEAIALQAFDDSGSLSQQEMAHRYFDRAAEEIKTPTTSPAVPDGFVNADVEKSRRDVLSRRLRRAATRDGATPGHRDPIGSRTPLPMSDVAACASCLSESRSGRRPDHQSPKTGGVATNVEHGVLGTRGKHRPSRPGGGTRRPVVLKRIALVK